MNKSHVNGARKAGKKKRVPLRVPKCLLLSASLLALGLLGTDLLALGLGELPSCSICPSSELLMVSLPLLYGFLTTTKQTRDRNYFLIKSTQVA